MREPVLHGKLEAFKLPEILGFLNSTQKTGTLTARLDTRESYIFFDSGSVVFAGSNQDQFRLGAILLRKKRITREELRRIDDIMRRDGGRFGHLAVQQGIFTAQQVQDFLKIQVSEIIYDCFVWSEGSFSFVDNMELPQHAVTISVDLGNLIMEGARRIQEWEECVRLLPDKSVVFRVVSRPQDEKITLSSDEWRILFLINGVRSLEELCHDAEEDPFDVYRIVYGLQANHLVEVAPPAEPELEGDSTDRPLPASHVDASQDSTVRQGIPAPDEPNVERDDTNLLVSDEARFSYSDIVRPTVAQLTISGEGRTNVVPLTGQEYLIGRQRDNTIQLSDLGVSGHHARIYRGPDGYIIEDLKSRNGTWLNGTRVFHAVLKEGDRLRVGATDLSYDVLYEG